MTHSIGLSGVFRRDRLAGGVYSFFENLLRGFAEIKSSHPAPRFEVTVFHGSAGLHWYHDQIKFRTVPDRFGRFAAEALVGAEVAGMDAALFANYFTPPLVRANRVVTIIHDLQYGHLSQFHPRRKRIWLDICHSWTLRRCDAVVAISAAVKQDLLAQFGDRWADRIHVIWNPVALDRFPRSTRHDFTGGRPYVMCVAMDRPQKNLYTVIRAFDQLKNKHPDHCLVMAGQLRSLRKLKYHQSRYFREQMPSTVDLVRELGLEDRVIVTGFVPDSVLGALYRDASVFVLPSTFEGFGMPAVESLAMGTPTLVSDLPVLREVTLGRAQYVAEPLNVNEWIEKISYLLTHGESLRPSQESIAEISHRFSPKTAAQQYLNVLGVSDQREQSL